MTLAETAREEETKVSLLPQTYLVVPAPYFWRISIPQRGWRLLWGTWRGGRPQETLKGGVRYEKIRSGHSPGLYQTAMWMRLGPWASVFMPFIPCLPHIQATHDAIRIFVAQISQPPGPGQKEVREL